MANKNHESRFFLLFDMGVCRIFGFRTDMDGGGDMPDKFMVTLLLLKGEAVFDG